MFDRPLDGTACVSRLVTHVHQHGTAPQQVDGLVGAQPLYQGPMQQLVEVLGRQTHEQPVLEHGDGGVAGAAQDRGLFAEHLAWPQVSQVFHPSVWSCARHTGRSAPDLVVVIPCLALL